MPLKKASKKASKKAPAKKKSAPAPKAELPTLAFESQDELTRWLHAHHESAPGLWLRFYKKGSGVRTVSYKEAVDVALCYGWIDGQVKGVDDACYVQRFTPRRPRSIWSKINRENVARLVAEGRMQPAGQREVDRAKADGRWDAAYDSPKTMELPPDFLDAVSRNAKAKAQLATLNRSSTFLIAFQLHQAKRPETRARRIATFIEKLAAKKPIG